MVGTRKVFRWGERRAVAIKHGEINRGAVERYLVSSIGTLLACVRNYRAVNTMAVS